VERVPRFRGSGPGRPRLAGVCAVGEAFGAFSFQAGVKAGRTRFEFVLGVAHQHGGVGALGDPHLGAVEPPAVALELGARHIAPVGAELECNLCDAAVSEPGCRARGLEFARDPLGLCEACHEEIEVR